MSLTFTFSGRQSELSQDIYPPIELDPDKTHVIGLIDFQTYNSIPNIEDENNKFYIGNNTVVIPSGQYEITDLEKYIKKTLRIKQDPNNSDFEYASSDEEIETKPREDYFSLVGNPNTLKCNIESSLPINFLPRDSIRDILGFESVYLKENEFHESSNLIQIIKINVLQIECNIVTGSYKNGKTVHTLHEFSPRVPAGYKIIEVPTTIIYLPVNTRLITNITIRIVDQDGRLINFKEEEITLRLHLKSI